MSVLTTAKSEALEQNIDSRCQKWIDLHYAEIYRGPSMYGGEMVVLYRHPDDRPEAHRIDPNQQVMSFIILTTHHNGSRRLSHSEASAREISNMMADAGSPKRLIITEWGSPQIVDRHARKPVSYRTQPVKKGTLISSIGNYTEPTHQVLTTGRTGQVKIKRITPIPQRTAFETGPLVTEVPLKLFDALYKIHGSH